MSKPKRQKRKQYAPIKFGEGFNVVRRLFISSSELGCELRQLGVQLAALDLLKLGQQRKHRRQPGVGSTPGSGPRPLSP